MVVLISQECTWIKTRPHYYKLIIRMIISTIKRINRISIPNRRTKSSNNQSNSNWNPKKNDPNSITTPN